MLNYFDIDPSFSSFFWYADGIFDFRSWKIQKIRSDISILELKLDSGFISDAQRAHAYSILATAYELTNRKLQAYSYYEKAMLANKNISNYRTEKNIFHLLWKYYYQEKVNKIKKVR